ncbi:MAG: two-component system sensor histidine kinase PhoQ [Candidatus Azotimanducaceae bacterium]|jgi:two-component system sensor histidine kinase PhoQ
MLVSGALVLVVFLGVMGLVLDNAYRESARQSLSERLRLHVYALIAATEEVRAQDSLSLYLPEELQEPHFNNMGSGLFAIVFDDQGAEIWRSRSTIGLNLDDRARSEILSTDTPGVMTFRSMLSSGDYEQVFFLTYPIIWQTNKGQSGFTYVVMQSFEPYQNEVAAFRNNLWGWLIAGVVVLVGLQALIMAWGLRPIAGLEKDLKAIEQGGQDYLEGQYPREIAGVTRSLNLLLSAERDQRERYRTTLADLAHSLKTPLAILKMEAEKPEAELEKVSVALVEQVDRMNDIISYQLERAVGTSSSLLKVKVEIVPVLEKLTKAMRQVYLDKGVVIASNVEPAIFPGDERDLLEMLGNLLDNACKYGHQKIELFAGIRAARLQFVVDDDGDGIDLVDRNRVLERGTRLDSRESGQGIGLAVVAEIVDRYDGQIEIGASELGGAKVTLKF